MQYSKMQLYSLLALRVLIGWHFLYEGLIKLVNPNWSSHGYLMDSAGFLKNLFHSMASNYQLQEIIDLINIYGLIIIGLGLILGLFNKGLIWPGIILLGMYYLSHPPFIGISYSIPTEGNYLFVNKVLIELSALIVLLVFPTSRKIGIDRLIFGLK